MYNISSHIEPTFSPTFPPSVPPNMIILQGTEENLGTLGVFLSSLLLSLGGCVAVVFSSLKQSRCKNISCCGIKCDRENLQAPEITV